jgi:hypothetical protein
MFVTKHPNRYLVNMSHDEMHTLRKLINAGFLLLEGEDGDGMWRHFTLAERKVIGHWRRKDPTQPTGPRRQRHLPPDQKRRKTKAKVALNDGLSSVA